MRISRNLWLVSWTSLLNDISSEMVYPLIGFFLTGSLGASPLVVGVIEGVAESLASFLKIASGRWSDRVRHRKWFAVAGYAISVVGKALTALAPAWGMVLAGRSLDKVGKGVRTAPRDALIAEEADGAHRGRAFGFHKAMDTTGAVVGVVIAFAALAYFGGSEEMVRRLMVAALLPSVVAIGVLMLVREQRRAASGESPAVGERNKGAGGWRPVRAWRELSGRLRVFYGLWFVFSLGASSDTFLFLWAHELGASIPQVVLMYLVFNVVNAATSEPAGRLSDRIGRRTVLTAGCVMYGAVYAGFALAGAFDAGLWALFVLFGLYGLQRALTDGVAKALVADLCPADAKATALGLLDSLAGVGVLLASVVGGLLWERSGPEAMLWFGAGCGVFAGVMLPWTLGRWGTSGVQRAPGT